MKKRLTIIIFTLIFNLILVGNVFATDVNARGNHIYTGKSEDWGWCSFNVKTSYMGNQYTGSGTQYVDGHDYVAYTHCGYNIEVPRGEASLVNIQLLNTGGTAVSSLNSGNFYAGSYRGWLLEPLNLTVYRMMYSYSWLQATSGDYRVKVNTSYTNNNFGLAGSDLYYTSFF